MSRPDKKVCSNNTASFSKVDALGFSKMTLKQWIGYVIVCAFSVAIFWIVCVLWFSVFGA